MATLQAQFAFAPDDQNARRNHDARADQRVNRRHLGKDDIPQNHRKQHRRIVKRRDHACLGIAVGGRQQNLRKAPDQARPDQHRGLLCGGHDPTEGQREQRQDRCRQRKIEHDRGCFFASGQAAAIIRTEIREQEMSDEGHYTVYLPAYGDKKLIKVLSQVKQAEWQVFSKHTKEAYTEGNVKIEPIHAEKFSKSLASATGVLCGAGFETPAEALYLNKKLLVIPMKRQYEQHFNAEGLKDLGVPVIKKLNKKNVKNIKQWVKSDQHVPVHFPDETQFIIDKLLEAHIQSQLAPVITKPGFFSFLKLKLS